MIVFQPTEFTPPPSSIQNRWIPRHKVALTIKILYFSKHSCKTEGQETSLIDVVESVYGEQASFVEPESFETAATSTQKHKSESPVWFGNEPLEPSIECDINPYPKDYFLECNGIDPNIDATDLLFLSYSKTLKSLSKKRQIQVKMKISQIMGQAELDEENEKTCESNHVDSSENEVKFKTSPKRLKCWQKSTERT